MPANSAEMLTLDDLLCFSIYSTNHALNRVYKPHLDALGLTYPQYLVMVALWEQDQQTVGRLGQCLNLESNTLTPLLKRLEVNGLIHRNRDPQDERQVLVRLSEKGHTLSSDAARIPDCILKASGLSREELQRLKADIAALQKRLERFSRSGPPSSPE